MWWSLFFSPLKMQNITKSNVLSIFIHQNNSIFQSFAQNVTSFYDLLSETCKYSIQWKVQSLFLCYQYKCSGHTQICLHFFIKNGYRVFHFHIHKPLNIHSNRSHRLTLQLQRHKTVNFKLLQVAHLSSLKT